MEKTSRVHSAAPLFAVVIVGVAIRTAVAATGWFYWDDLTLHAQALSDPLPDILTRSHDGHLMPAAWLVYWLLAKLAPLSWPPAVAVLAVLNLAACAGVAWLCWTIAPRRTSAFPIALYAAAPLTLPVTTWLAAAVNSLPLHAATAFVAATAIRYARRPTAAKLAALAAITVAGCAFSERMLLSAPFALLLAWCLKPTKRLLRATAATFIPLAAWAAVYAIAVGDPRPAPDGAASAWEVVYRGIVKGLIPTAAGGPWHWDRWIPSPPWATPPAAAVAAGVAVIAAAAWWSRKNLRAWLPTLIYPFVALSALAIVRNGPDTAPEIAQTLRHFSETAVFAAAAAATGDWQRRAPRLTAAALVASAVVSTATFTAQWQPQPARDYFTHLRADLARHDGPVLNQAVDFSVLTPITHPDNQLERLLPGVERWSDQPTVVTPDGTLADAQLYPMRTTTAGRDGDCGTRIDANTEKPLRLDGPLMDREWVVRLNYLADEDGTASLRLSGKAQEFPVKAGLNQIYVQVAGGGDTLRVGTGPGTCVQTSEIGLITTQK